MVTSSINAEVLVVYRRSEHNRDVYNYICPKAAKVG